MDFEKALELVDRLVYQKVGKHLNDLEREVFIGSCQGRTYEEIYPLNPQYIEKYVGYKLWQKLSNALGEKVTKKRIRGALERALKRHEEDGVEVKEETSQEIKRVFLSYLNQEPDYELATQLATAIEASGHQAFRASVGLTEENWLAQIDSELEQCDYFLLLLSPQAATSEMLIEELRQAKDKDFQTKPIILTIRINCPPTVPLNHDLRRYLQGTYQRDWRSPEETPGIIQEITNILSDQGGWCLPLIDEATPTYHLSTTPPLPVAEPELPKGQVRLASAFYIKRVPGEEQCYQEIVKPGALIRLKAPRQMGKTSLMARILYQAKEQGYRTVPLSFQHADKGVFTNLDQLLRWFCTKVCRKLRLPYKVDDYWTDTYGSKDNCTAIFEDLLLPEADKPLVLGLDEVDRVFQYPKIADDFFGLLRAWYEEAGYGYGDSDLWEKLRLVVVHSTEVYLPLNVNQSPFNVGLPIELREFTNAQVADLAQRYGLSWHSEQVEQLMNVVGGHPYLVQVALYHLVKHQLTLEKLAETAPTEAGVYGDHLRRHLWNLQQHPELALAFSQVVTMEKPIELESVLAFKLHSLGLVKLKRNEVTPRFELYRQYFRDRLGN